MGRLHPPGRFNERLVLSLAANPHCVLMDDELNILPTSTHVSGCVCVFPTSTHVSGCLLCVRVSSHTRIMPTNATASTQITHTNTIHPHNRTRPPPQVQHIRPLPTDAEGRP